MKRPDRIVVQNAQIMFRNFSGAEKMYNRAGDRNFLLMLDDDSAEHLIAEGWNVKYLKPRDEGDEPRPYIEVAVSFKAVPPKIVLVTGQGKTALTEDAVDILDFVEIKKIDLSVNPYMWEVNDKRGIKAYLKTMYITIEEEDFERDYYDIPDTAGSEFVDHDEVL